MWQLSKWNNEVYVWGDEVFTHNELDKIIELGKALNIKTAKTEKGLKSDVRNNGIDWFSTNGTAQYNFMYERLTGMIHALNDRFFKFDLSHIEDLQFTQYNKGEYYHCHKDQGYSKGYARKLTFVVQLTDEKDYEGGELLLYSKDLINPDIMSKQRGRLVAFPSYILHEVKEVKKGTRHSLVGWVHGPRFR